MSKTQEILEETSYDNWEAFVDGVLNGNGDIGGSDRLEEKPCQVCRLDPKTETVETRNRSLFSAGGRTFIDPVCEDHDQLTVKQTVEDAMEYGGPKFVKALVTRGVLDGEDLYRAIVE
jgi:hypothetical protein